MSLAFKNRLQFSSARAKLTQAAERLALALPEPGTSNEDNAERRERFPCDFSTVYTEANECDIETVPKPSDGVEKALSDLPPLRPTTFRNRTAPPGRPCFRRLTGNRHAWNAHYMGPDLDRDSDDENVAKAWDLEESQHIDLSGSAPVVSGAANILRAISKSKVRKPQAPDDQDEDSLHELEVTNDATSVQRPSARRSFAMSPNMQRFRSLSKQSNIGDELKAPVTNMDDLPPPPNFDSESSLESIETLPDVRFIRDTTCASTCTSLPPCPKPEAGYESSACSGSAAGAKTCEGTLSIPTPPMGPKNSAKRPPRFFHSAPNY